MTPCTLVKIHRRFGRTPILVTQAVCYILHTNYFPGTSVYYRSVYSRSVLVRLDSPLIRNYPPAADSSMQKWQLFTNGKGAIGRSQWPRGLRRRSATARIPSGAWMLVCCECCMLSGRGLCDELITLPEKSHRLWCVVVCDLENLKNEEAMTRVGSQRHSKRKGP